MRWPWTRPVVDHRRGKLTLLADHKIIFGVPQGVPQDSIEWAASALAALAETHDKGRVVVFPFPVDVDDQRGLR